MVKDKRGIRVVDIRDTPIKVLGPLGDESDVEAVREVILSGWWGKGPEG